MVKSGIILPKLTDKQLITKTSPDGKPRNNVVQEKMEKNRSEVEFPLRKYQTLTLFSIIFHNNYRFPCNALYSRCILKVLISSLESSSLKFYDNFRLLVRKQMKNACICWLSHNVLTSLDQTDTNLFGNVSLNR